MSASRRTAADVESLCKLMATYGLSELRCGDVILVRPPFATIVDQKPGRTPDGEDDDDFSRLRRMSPDEQDRALRLGPLGPLGSG